MATEKDQDRAIPAEPITRRKLSDQVFERLWSMIVSGELAPGDTFPSERVLMDRFRVGRPAVREAMQALSNKGVITISQGERSRVNELSAGIAVDQVDEIAKLLLSTEPANLAHLKQVRKIIEAGSVDLAAQNCTPDDAMRLRALIDAQRKELQNPKGFIEADIAFHVAIAELSGNPLLQVVTRAMLTWLLEYYTPLLHWSGRENTTLSEHAKLVDYLATQDSAAAVQLITEHLDRSDPLYAAKAS
ncbi:transcriptional regulator NanR [Antarctobacter jejuensis]|uniref:transcriptional regulator NanR n=1 Tax=Antarctobacter jejuensis TaxID=1439938 RepID=UPI003FD48D6F